jgi:hypothetical protein
MKRDMRKISPRMVLVLLLGLLLVAAPVLTRAQEPGDVVINEFLADPAPDISGDANGDGERSSTDDEFVEIVNITDHEIDISGWTFTVNDTVRHTFPEGTVLPATCGIVVFGGGTPTGNFGGCLVQVASTGSLVLLNTGATIKLQDDSLLIDAYTYIGDMADDDQSLTRFPDLTGPVFVRHSEVPAAAGALFSPGTLVDGSPFMGCLKVVYLPLIQK